jgi:hypothetical protein
MLRDAMLEKARAQLKDGTLERYASEIVEHKRDPYSLVEEIVNAVEGQTASPSTVTPGQKTIG